FSPDGRRFATASHDRTARVWSLATGATEAVLGEHGVLPEDLATFASGPLTSFPGNLSWAALALSSRNDLLPPKPTQAMHCLAWSPDRRTVATGSADQSVRLWNTDGTLRQRWDLAGRTIWSITFTPDSRRLLIAGSGPTGVGRASLFDLVTGREL